MASTTIYVQILTAARADRGELCLAVIVVWVTARNLVREGEEEEFILKSSCYWQDHNSHK